MNLKVDLQRLRTISEAEKFTRSKTGFWDQNCSVIKDNLTNIDYQNHDKEVDTIVSRSIKFKPNRLQRRLLKQCFEAYRYVYNQAISYILRVTNMAKKMNVSISPRMVEFNVHKNIKITDGLVPDFILPLPASSRKEALREAVKNYKICIKHKKLGLCKTYLLKHKRRNAATFRIRTNAIKLTGNKLVIFERRIIKLIKDEKLTKDYKYATITNNGKKRLSKFIDAKGNPESWPLITYTHGNYYIIVSGERKAEVKEGKKDICAIDPGIVNFHTIYDGEVNIEGARLYETKLQKINNRIDKITTAKPYFNGAKRKRMIKRELKLRAKVSNIVYDFRHKLASKLCSKYKVILLPKLGIKCIAKNLRRQVNRKLYALSHFKFNELIKHVAKRTGTTVIHCLESYTSKTCGNCGNLQHVDEDRIFRCKECNWTKDRDENACKNILIRTLNNYLLSSVV
jgi:IS605 OrfB family transposase